MQSKFSALDSSTKQFQIDRHLGCLLCHKNRTTPKSKLTFAFNADMLIIMKLWYYYFHDCIVFNRLCSLFFDWFKLCSATCLSTSDICQFDSYRWNWNQTHQNWKIAIRIAKAAIIKQATTKLIETFFRVMPAGAISRLRDRLVAHWAITATRSRIERCRH